MHFYGESTPFICVSKQTSKHCHALGIRFPFAFPFAALLLYGWMDRRMHGCMIYYRYGDMFHIMDDPARKNIALMVVV